MTATILDGKATAKAIREELTGRVAKLPRLAITPGLGTVLVGDDPGSQSYVAGKHRDCAQVGIVSIRRDLPASASQQQVEDVIAELNADPACTGYIVQLPLPAGLDAQRVLGLIDPDKDADGLQPVNLGKLVLGEPGPLPCTPEGHRRAAAPLRRADRGRRRHRDRPRHHRRPRARPAADPAQRERHRDPVPHRHQGPGGAHQRTPTSWWWRLAVLAC